MTLQQLREAKFMLQLELAEKAGVAPSTISKWERALGKPNLRHVRELAIALETTPEVIQQAVLDTAAQVQAEAHHTFWEEPGEIGIPRVKTKANRHLQTEAPATMSCLITMG